LRAESRIAGESLSGISIAPGNQTGPTLRQILQPLGGFFRIDQCEGQRVGIACSGAGLPDPTPGPFSRLAFSRLERFTLYLAHFHARRGRDELEVVWRTDCSLMSPRQPYLHLPPRLHRQHRRETWDVTSPQ